MDARAAINGRLVPLAEAGLAITDDGAARGDGGYETVGVWDGRPFRMDDHLDRLAVSLAAIGLPPADRAQLEAEAGALLDGWDGDGALRFYLTASGTRLLTLAPPPTRPAPRHLVPQPAPWIRPLGTYDPAGAKTMSYGPNMAATRAAQRAGGDEALLLSLEGHILEGPTFGVLWVSGDTVNTVKAPSPQLGIVESISRRTVLQAAADAGLRVELGSYHLDDLATASEFLICSAVRPVLPIDRIGDLRFPPATQVRDLLAKSLDAARRG